MVNVKNNDPKAIINVFTVIDFMISKYHIGSIMILVFKLICLVLNI